MSNELTQAQREHLRRLLNSPDGSAKVTGGPMYSGSKDAWSRVCINALRKKRLITATNGAHGVPPTVTITAAGRAAMEG
jgi:hypothetical protein